MKKYNALLLFCFFAECLARKSTKHNLPRIIGGVPADIAAFPFILALILKPPKRAEKFQGAATIVSQKWALSAAHVTQRISLKNSKPTTTVILRGNTVYWKGDHKGSMDHKVSKIINHKKFGKKAEYDCDISLLKVDEPFGAGAEAPIAVASRKLKYSTDYYLDSAGWGSNRSNQNRLQNRLQAVTLQFFSFYDCLRAFGRNFTGNMVCGGWARLGPKGTCWGDQGGPVVQMGVLVGIISWGPPSCGLKKHSTLFTKVGAFQGWLESVGEDLGITFRDKVFGGKKTLKRHLIKRRKKKSKKKKSKRNHQRW